MYRESLLTSSLTPSCFNPELDKLIYIEVVTLLTFQATCPPSSFDATERCKDISITVSSRVSPFNCVSQPPPPLSQTQMQTTDQDSCVRCSNFTLPLVFPTSSIILRKYTHIYI